MLGLNPPNRLMGIINDLEDDKYLDITTRLLKSMSFNIIDSKPSSRVLDFEATRYDDSETIYFIRAKRGGKKVTPDELQAAVGKKRDGKEMSPVFISTAGFTEEASKYADLLNVSLADDEKLSLLIKKFDLEDDLEKDATKKVMEEDDKFLPSISELGNMMQWGNDFFNSGNYFKAIEYYDKALVMKPTYDLAWMMKGNCMNALGRYEEAVECFRKALDINPDSEEGWYNLGSTYYNLERFEEELKCYDKALEIDPNYVPAWNNKGATLHQMKKYQEAILCYDKVLRIEPENIKVLNNRGVALKHIEDFEEALDSFDKALRIRSDYVDAWLNKGLLLHEMERYLEAISSYDRVLTKWKSPEVICQKGTALTAVGKYRQAIEAFEMALSLKPGWDLALDEKAKAENMMREVQDQKAREEEEEMERREREKQLREEMEKEKKAKAKETDVEEALKEDFRDVMDKDVEPGTCRECGKGMNREAKFCPNCGTRAAAEAEEEDEYFLCSECGAWVTDDDDVCPDCGADLTEDEDYMEGIEDEDELKEPPAVLPVGKPHELEELEEQRELERALDREEMLLERGRLLRGLERYDDALKSIDEAMEMSDRPALWMEKANILAMMERYDDALDLYDKVLRRDKDNLAALLNKESVLVELDELEKAIELDTELLEINPDEPMIWVRKGSLLRQLGKNQEAIECYDKAIELGPDLAEVWNAEGAALLSLEKYDDAVLCLDRAIQIDPDFAEAWCNKGSVTLAGGDAKKSIQYFDRAIDIDEENALAWANKGCALYEMGRYEEAVECYDEALALYENSEWLNAKAWALISADNLDDALVALDEVIMNDEEDAVAWNFRGVAFMRKKELAEAFDCFERALAIDSGYTDARSNRDRIKRKIEKEVEREKPLEPREGKTPEPKKERPKKKKGRKLKGKKPEPEPELEEAIEEAEEREQEEIEAEEFKCQFCGAIGSMDDVFCEECGQKFTKKMKEEAVEKELEEALGPEVEEEKPDKKKGKSEKEEKPAKEPAEETKKGKGKKKKLSKQDLIDEMVKVPGVGFSKAEDLYNAGFDETEKLKKATAKELAEVKGISESLAKRIKRMYK